MNGHGSTNSRLKRLEAVDLERLAESCESLEGVEKSELQMGDRLLVTTLNSVYDLRCLGDGRFLVRGGWFDKRNLSPAIVRIRGCSFGGSAINRRLLAAAGLHIEFDNGVITTAIRRFSIWRNAEPTDTN